MKTKLPPWPLLVLVAILASSVAARSEKPPVPPRAYTTAAAGATDMNTLAERFKKAAAAHDMDAAMQMFHWQPGDKEGLESQRFWWGLLTRIFAVPLDIIEAFPTPAGPEAKTALPVIGLLRVRTGDTNYDLLIGKSERGLYITPPIWPKAK